MARVGLLEKVTSEQRLAGNEETDGVDIWRKSDTSRKKAKESFEVGENLPCRKTSKGTCVTGAGDLVANNTERGQRENMEPPSGSPCST